MPDAGDLPRDPLPRTRARDRERTTVDLAAHVQWGPAPPSGVSWYLFAGSSEWSILNEPACLDNVPRTSTSPSSRVVPCASIACALCAPAQGYAITVRDALDRRGASALVGDHENALRAAIFVLPTTRAGCSSLAGSPTIFVEPFSCVLPSARSAPGLGGLGAEQRAVPGGGLGVDADADSVEPSTTPPARAAAPVSCNRRREEGASGSVTLPSVVREVSTGIGKPLATSAVGWRHG